MFSKNILLFVILAASSGIYCSPRISLDDSIDPYIFETEINTTIVNIINSISDPLTVENLNVTLPDGFPLGIQGYIAVSQLEFAGIHSLVISNLTFGLLPPSLDFVINIPTLTLHTQYVSSITIAGMSILGGEGEVDIKLEDVVLKGNTLITIIPQIILENLKIAFNLGTKSIFDVTGVQFLGGDAKNATILTESVVKAINLNEEEISGLISPLVQDVLNSIISSITPTLSPTQSQTETQTQSQTQTHSTTTEKSLGFKPTLSSLMVLFLMALTGIQFLNI